MAAPLNINANLNLNPASINASAKQVQQALGRITGQASEFQKSLDASTARVFAFGATTAVINGVTQSFKALISTTITVQSKLVEINSILGAGAQEFNKYRNSIFQVAKVTGQSFNTVAEGAAELARQGLSATESAKRLEASLILTRISGLGAEQSVKALTAAMNGFTSAGLTAEQVVNKIVAVDTAFAVSAQDLADGFSRAGSTAEDAGVSFDELLGLITAVEQRTARGGAVIGNAFKSIFTRLSRGTTIEDLKSLGVAIDANQNGVQKLQALSKALENISDPTVASQIKELAGGVFQINVVSAALKDIGSEASVFGQATAKSFDATNEATSKNIALNEQLSAQINSLVVSVTSLGAKIGGITFGPLLKNLVGLATKLSEMLDGALDPEKGNKFVQGLFKFIGGFLSGPGLALFTVAFAKIFGTVIKFAKEGFKTVMEMGSATERIKNIEGGIVGLLQKDANLRKTLASTTATQAQKEQAVIAAIQKENQLLTHQEQLVRKIAMQASARGVRGHSASGGFAGKRGKRFAAGGAGEMEPNLMTAMMNEARDAPSGAMPFVTNFRGSPAVMNTSEMQVRINGREEILREDQIPRFNRGSKRPIAGTKQRQRALNRDGKFIMLHGEQTGYKLNKFYMGRDPKKPSLAGKPTLSPTENNKTLINVPTYGIPKDKKGIGDINSIIEGLRDSSLDQAIKIARNLSNNEMPDANRARIKSEIASQINNGTHKAFAGNIQELALGSLLTDSAFDDYVSQGTGSTFDLNLEGQSKLKNLYKVRRHKAETGEVKASGSNSLAGDAARKIFRVSNMGEAIHSKRNEAGLTKSEFDKKFPNGVGEKGLKYGAVQTKIFGKGKKQGKLPKLSQIKGGNFAKGSLPNLKIKRYNEGSMMGGMLDDPMMLMMLLGGGAMAGSEGKGEGKGKDLGPVAKIKAETKASNQKIVKDLARKEAQKKFDNSRTGKFVNKTKAKISNAGSKIGSGVSRVASSRVGQGVGQGVGRVANLGARGVNSVRSGVGNVRQFGANLMQPARAMGSSVANSAQKVANSRFGQNRVVRGAARGVKGVATNRTPSMRGGMGLTMAGQAIGMATPKLEEAGMDTAAAFTDATSTITQFAATGAMIGGPMGAAAGAVVGFGKSLLDAKAMTEQAKKVEEDAAKVSPEMAGRLSASRIMREESEDMGIGNMRFGDKNRQKVLSNLAKETGIASLDTSAELEQLRAAMVATKEGSTQRTRAEEAFRKGVRRSAKLMINSSRIQKTLNDIKKKELLIDKERKNNIAKKLGDDISKQRQRTEVGQRLMEGNPATQGDFSNLLSRDLGMSKAIGDTGQAKALVQELKADLAGATTQKEKDTIQKELNQASADFKSTIVESAIFMKKKQMEAASELTRAQADRAKMIAARDTMRSNQQVSDMTKAGKGDIMDLTFIDVFKKELERIRSPFNTSTQKEKNVDLARLSAMVDENIAKEPNEGRKKFLRQETMDKFSEDERKGAASLSVFDPKNPKRAKEYLDAGTSDAETEFADQLKKNAAMIEALGLQGDGIKDQMKKYALAFDSKKVQEGIDKTNKTLQEAADNLLGYKDASEQIGAISGKILKLGETANKAIDDQTTRLEGFSEDITTLKAEMKTLTK